MLPGLDSGYVPHGLVINTETVLQQFLQCHNLIIKISAALGHTFSDNGQSWDS